MKQKHKNKITDEELIEEYNKNPILGKLSVHFNLPDVTIWRRCKKLGLNFKNGGRNIPKFNLQDILEGKHPQYPTVKLKRRLIKENIIKYECSICNLYEWRGKPLVLELDHIDGNNHNHKIGNLRLLCPNCHSQTDTYCGRNI